MKLFNNTLDLRNGFTLVELLLVMSIIAVLASLSLVVVGEAQFDANKSATQSRISMIHSILQQRLDDYQERRLPLRNLTEYDLSGDGRRLARNLKSRIIADIINVEMPRTYWNIGYEMASSNGPNDVTYPTSEFTEWVLNNQDIDERIIDDLAIRNPANARRFRKAVSPTEADGWLLYPEGAQVAKQSVTFDPGDSTTYPTLQQQITLSEYLYQILQATETNGIPAIEAIGSRSVANTDGDAYPEVVDSWGNPIIFQIEMYFDNGELVHQGFETGIQNQANNQIPANLNAGLSLDDDTAVAVRNIRIRLLSTGKGVEAITN